MHDGLPYQYERAVNLTLPLSSRKKKTGGPHSIEAFSFPRMCDSYDDKNPSFRSFRESNSAAFTTMIEAVRQISPDLSVTQLVASKYNHILLKRALEYGRRYPHCMINTINRLGPFNLEERDIYSVFANAQGWIDFRHKSINGKAQMCMVPTSKFRNAGGRVGEVREVYLEDYVELLYSDVKRLGDDVHKLIQESATDIRTTWGRPENLKIVDKDILGEFVSCLGLRDKKWDKKYKEIERRGKLKVGVPPIQLELEFGNQSLSLQAQSVLQAFVKRKSFQIKGDTPTNYFWQETFWIPALKQKWPKLNERTPVVFVGYVPSHNEEKDTYKFTSSLYYDKNLCVELMANHGAITNGELTNEHEYVVLGLTIPGRVPRIQVAAVWWKRMLPTQFIEYLDKVVSFYDDGWSM